MPLRTHTHFTDLILQSWSGKEDKVTATLCVIISLDTKTFSPFHRLLSCRFSQQQLFHKTPQELFNPFCFNL